MNTQILERLRKEFAFVGDEKISGHTAMKIINDVIEELTIPKDVEDAQKYIASCHRDMGFMGSPEYERQKTKKKRQITYVLNRSTKAHSIAPNI